MSDGILYTARLKSSAVAELNCNSLENFRGWTVVLYGQGLLHRHWKNFVVIDLSQKPRNFSTLNALQCAVCVTNIIIFHSSYL